MANQYVNKVIYGGTTLIDITDTTAIASKVADGYFFYDKSGAKIEGTSTFDADTSDATATGTMPNIGSQTAYITTVAQTITPSLGYHDGGGSISIDATEQAKIIAGNIKNGVTILGVEGTYTGSELIKATVGSATPRVSQQVILPSSVGDYDYFTQFTVAAIPYTETDNAAGGKTVTIAGAA